MDSAAHHPPGCKRFGVFEVDLRAGELRKRGLKVRLQYQPFQVLEMLLEHAGVVVTREELRKKLWPADTFVDFEHGLNKAINKIREALGDSAESPRFIDTVARRGYRFIAQVTLVDEAPASRSEAAAGGLASAKDESRVVPPTEPASGKSRPRPLAWNVVGIAAILVLAILAAWKVHSGSRASPPIRSLAVLPMENLSSDASQDYFADGMTDELITDGVQACPETSAANRARIERGRHRGRLGAALRRRGPHHGATDPGV
jgi:DNA-binding winged helix-turn-helix (wHTH) protein